MMAEKRPRKALPDRAHTRPEARQGVRWPGAGLTSREEGAPGTGAGLGANRVGPLRPLPSASLHDTRRRRRPCSQGRTPAAGTPPEPRRPLGRLYLSVVSACLLGGRGWEYKLFFVMRIKALPEVPSPRAH